MTVAEAVVQKLVVRYNLPNALLALIYYSLLDVDYQNYPQSWVENFYIKAFDRIFHNVPPILPYDPSEFSTTIRDLSGLTPEDVSALWESHFKPSEYDKKTHELVDRGYYLHSSYISNVLGFNVSLDIPEARRFEHTYVLGPTGTGKTQLLQQLILSDLKRPGTVIVIDSQADLINNIKALKEIPKERLVIIDPTDVEYPLALNIFDIGQDRIARYSPLEYERHINGVIEQLGYVFSSILGSELTSKQGVALNFVLRLLIHIPNATIHTLRDIFTPKGLEPFTKYVAKLSQTGQQFFQHEFNNKAFDETKTQILRRLYSILENPTIERLFSHPKSRLNLKDEMDSGKVILINTSKDLLKQQGCTFFGRFFLSLITQAALERASQHPSKRCPTYVYIDEVGDYIDPTVNTILEQTRKYKIALTMAHQQLAQLPPEVRASVATNTSIKFIGSVSSEDARALADNMRTTWETLRNQKRLHFSLYVRGYLHKPCTIAVRPGRMEAQSRRTPQEMQELLESTRQRYSSNQPRKARGNSADPPRGFVEKPRRKPDPRFVDVPDPKKPPLDDDSDDLLKPLNRS